MIQQLLVFTVGVLKNIARALTSVKWCPPGPTVSALPQNSSKTETMYILERGKTLHSAQQWRETDISSLQACTAQPHPWRVLSQKVLQPQWPRPLCQSIFIIFSDSIRLVIESFRNFTKMKTHPLEKDSHLNLQEHLAPLSSHTSTAGASSGALRPSTSCASSARPWCRSALRAAARRRGCRTSAREAERRTART